MAAPCYHCGQPIPTGLDLSVTIAGQSHALCCAGCQAVAQAIVTHGLEDYYHHRDALPDSPREALPAVVDTLRLYDHPDFQRSFVQRIGNDDSLREASLILEGITCSACIWLNEQHLAKLPGVIAVEINYATRRARIRWDESRIRLSDILAAVAAIGYRAHPYDSSRSEDLARQERRNALWRVFVAGFGMMQVMMYAVPVYFASAGEMTPAIEQLMRWASLVLTVPVITYSAAPFFRNAWRDLRLRRVGMDVPVALGIGTAFAASVWATLTASGEVYFDSVTMFVFFLLSGRFLEMNARHRAVSGTEALAKLLPAVATRLNGFPDSRDATQILVAELCVDDVVRVLPGESIPADGVVLEGESNVDESLLTGESAPVDKSPGLSVTGGAINRQSPLLVKVTAVGEGTRLSAIVRLMERAAMDKPKIVETADRVASRFIVVLLLLALVVAMVWWMIDPRQALWVTVSVLVVSCPCALSLATPIALTVASGAMARVGLLVTRSQAVETLARASHFVFDKTGTLTSGRMRLLEVVPLSGRSPAECLSIAAALEEASEHPIAVSLRDAAGKEAKAEWMLSEPKNDPGAGVTAQWNGRVLRLGRPDYVHELHHQPWPTVRDTLLDSGDTVIALGDETGWLAAFRLGDRPRDEAAPMIAALRAAGKHVSLLTGDAEPAARRVARLLGIERVCAGASPQEKQHYVAGLQ
ncbi:MAG TPA: heavy metal translocating P-type ATPase, partial [Accumulibacter sp.]|nr:heavy metal translocating P-type ATPase [Accumulibacter sp.]